MSLQGHIGYLKYFPIYRGVGLVYYLLQLYTERFGYESKPWYPDGTLSWFMDVYSPKTW